MSKSVKVQSEGLTIRPYSERNHAQDFSRGGRTKQSFKAECDINAIMAKFRKTEVITHVQRGEPIAGDLASVPDFMTAQNIVAAASQSFALLPSNLRKRFHNDPTEFLDFVHDENNLDEMVKLGIAKLKPVGEPEAAPATPVAVPGQNPAVASSDA